MLCNKWNVELTKKLTDIADFINKPEFSQSKGQYQQHCNGMQKKKRINAKEIVDPSEEKIHE